MSPGCSGTPEYTELLATTNKMIFLSSAHLLLPLFLSPNTTHTRRADVSQVPCATCSAHGALQTITSQPQNAAQQGKQLSWLRGQSQLPQTTPTVPPGSSTATLPRTAEKDKAELTGKRTQGKSLARGSRPGNAGLYSLKTMLNFPCLSAQVLLPHPSFPGGYRGRFSASDTHGV